MNQTHAVRKSKATRIPELHNGDRLSRDEFMRRYEAAPPGTWAELIGGEVYMPSPVGREHGIYHMEMNLVLGYYKAHTPVLEGADNTTTYMDEESATQPDAMLRLLEEYGGQSRWNEENYLEGAPEFIAQIAHSSVAVDMGKKRDRYEQAGVLEYLVVCVEEQELHWFHFPSKRELKSDANGIYKSKVFPGLWINGPALLARDSANLLATIQEGCASPQHAAFVKKMQRKQRSR
ncbi:MAG TPA: Uma2 family endonuclease [Gemmataceae bacterium]|nr:Uma2 family endonuclease [Gemmataceae bacterium]